MEKYLLCEIVDEDLGLDEPTATTVPLAIFDDYQSAQNYAKKYTNVQTTDHEFEKLKHGELIIQTLTANPKRNVKKLPNYHNPNIDDWQN